jgi:hypothetical protein
MIKKVFLTLFSLFLTYRAFEILKLLGSASADEFGWKSILALSIILNVFITGIFAFLGFAFKTSKVLPSSYYQIKNPKRLKLIYRILGLKYFKWFLLKVFWGKEKNRKRYFNGGKSGLENFDMQTRQSEFGHLAALVAVSIASIYSLLMGHQLIFIISTAINILGNLYPIILQRVHRIQIERLTAIVDRKQNKKV